MAHVSTKLRRPPSNGVRGHQHIVNSQFASSSKDPAKAPRMPKELRVGTVRHANVTQEAARALKKRYSEEQYNWLMMYSGNQGGSNPNRQHNGESLFLDAPTTMQGNATARDSSPTAADFAASLVKFRMNMAEVVPERLPRSEALPQGHLVKSPQPFTTLRVRLHSFVSTLRKGYLRAMSEQNLHSAGFG